MWFCLRVSNLSFFFLVNKRHACDITSGAFLIYRRKKIEEQSLNGLQQNTMRLGFLLANVSL
jgi:hypothetical protein